LLEEGAPVAAHGGESIGEALEALGGDRGEHPSAVAEVVTGSGVTHAEIRRERPEAEAVRPRGADDVHGAIEHGSTEIAVVVRIGHDIILPLATYQWYDRSRGSPSRPCREIIVLHTLLIVGHAAAGFIALILGCAVLVPPRGRRSPRFLTYLVSVVALVVFLVAVVVVDWPGLEGGQRVTFSLLCGLGVYTAWRAIRAHRLLEQRPAKWRTAYVDHVGFTVISLFDGFVLVEAIDLGAPLPVVIGVGAAGVIAGILAVNRVKATVRRESAAIAAAHEPSP
jgi:hypothetical protein